MGKELSLEEIHNETYKLLKKLHEICELLNIKYYLAYGTLLGAVRHKGFIPWDDDVDVWMPRCDLDKLTEYVNNKMPYSNIRVHNRENTKNYPFGIPRLSNDSFRYIDTFGLKEFELGVFIDIYPLDNYSNEISNAKKMIKKIRKKNKLYFYYINTLDNNFMKSLVKKIISFFLHIRYRKNYATIVENKINMYLMKFTSDDDDFVGVPSWTSVKEPQRFKKSFFEDRLLLEFENSKFYCPIGYEQILKMCYGDYMKLPKEDDRNPYHNYIIYKKGE